MSLNRAALFLFSLCVVSAARATDNLVLVRSLAGPHGTISGSRFVFDETRNRFVFPQDDSLTIYFEWRATPGLHVLSGFWKQPDGKIVTISPDVKIDAPGDQLNCYWIYQLTQGLPNGIWTLEIKIDGQPAGSHSFEIAGMTEARKEPDPTPAAPVAPRQPTINEIFTSVKPSLVWIYKIDADGHKVDTSSGFVAAPNRIVTAFQAVDGAKEIQVELSNGIRAGVPQLATWSRTGDWAVIPFPTPGIQPLERGNPNTVAVGERLIVFNFETGSRVIGGVDIAGRSSIPGFGARIQIAPPVAAEAAGGPLLDVFGHVVGILGGSLHPGGRYGGRATSVSPALFHEFNVENSATPISEIDLGKDGEGKTFEELAAAGIMTVPITPMQEFQYGGATSNLPKDPTTTLPRDLSEFSVHDNQIYIYSLWVRRGKISKGEVSAKVYDAGNHLRVQAAGRKISLGEIPMRTAFSFSPSQFEPGVYRVDVLWDGQPAWRTFVKVTN